MKQMINYLCAAGRNLDMMIISSEQKRIKDKTEGWASQGHSHLSRDCSRVSTGAAPGSVNPQQFHAKYTAHNVKFPQQGTHIQCFQSNFLRHPGNSRAAYKGLSLTTLIPKPELIWKALCWAGIWEAHHIYALLPFCRATGFEMGSEALTPHERT